jgi:hypothetical protein
LGLAIDFTFQHIFRAEHSREPPRFNLTLLIRKFANPQHALLRILVIKRTFLVIRVINLFSCVRKLNATEDPIFIIKILELQRAGIALSILITAEGRLYLFAHSGLGVNISVNVISSGRGLSLDAILGVIVGVPAIVLGELGWESDQAPEVVVTVLVRYLFGCRVADVNKVLVLTAGVVAGLAIFFTHLEFLGLQYRPVVIPDIRIHVFLSGARVCSYTVNSAADPVPQTQAKKK